MNAQKNSGSMEKLRKSSQWKDVWIRLRRNKLAMVGMVIAVLLALMAIFAPVIAPYDYQVQSIAERLQMPSAQHLMGTDNMGRDILSRLIYGGRISLLVSLLAVIVSLVIGGLLGAVSGYMGGKVDAVIMRLMDILMAIPGILMAVCISAALGGGVWQTALAIAVAGIAGVCRLVRGQTLTLRNQEYIEAARASGSGTLRILLSNIIPNCLAPIIVNTTMSIGGNIMMISALSFVGLGVQPPIPEWGAILNSGREYVSTFWPLITFPGIAIALTMFGFNVFGDGLRDALDPKLKQ
ncbi:MAG: ABC transporter permease [Oscillospiraceae bacterium]|nr:ABC transporter permease [Oscillospiraceae bacterium]